MSQDKEFAKVKPDYLEGKAIRNFESSDEEKSHKDRIIDDEEVDPID